MHRISTRFGVALFLAVITGSASGEKLVFQNVTIIDTAASVARPGMTVVIDGPRIQAIEDSPTFGDLETARIIDGNGKYLIPGLWDMHVHLRDYGGTIPLFVVNGVTGIRDMGSDPSSTQALSKAISAGTVLGPRIKTAGLMLESSGWLRQYVELMRRSASEDDVRKFLETRLEVGDAEAASKAVALLAESGSDFIKIRHTPDKESYLATAEAARRLGLQLTGHYLWTVSLIDMSNAGQASIEHNILPGFNERDADEKRLIFSTLARNQTHWVPTLVATEVEKTPSDALRKKVADRKGEIDPRMKYLSPEIRQSWLETIEMNEKDDERPPVEVIRQMVDGSDQFLRDARDAGLVMMAGTDAPTTGVFFGFSLHDEMRLLVETYGFTPIESLQAATIIPAKFLGLDAELGSVEVGKLADLVLLGEDPLANITNTRKIEMVIIDGRAYDASALHAILEEIEEGILSGTERPQRVPDSNN